MSDEVSARVQGLVAAVGASNGGRGMGLEQVRRLAEQLLAGHGLKALGWTFRFDGAMRRAGCCRHRSKEVTLSLYYVTLNRDKPGDVVDTLLHEIAHALTGPGKGHGPAWKAMCKLIGARPVRCYDSAVVAMPLGRYRAVCPTCSKEFYRHRKPTLSPHRWYYCRTCGTLAGRLTYHAT